MLAPEDGIYAAGDMLTSIQGLLGLNPGKGELAYAREFASILQTKRRATA